MTVLGGTRIAVIGAGAIGGAVIDRVVAGGFVTAQAVVACETREERRRAIADRYGVRVSGEAAGAAGSDVIVLAVPPVAMAAVLDALRPAGAPTPLVVSFAGGVPLEWVESRLAPGTPVVRVNPNAPSIVGEGFNPIAYGRHATGPARALADAFLGALGAAPEVPDRLMNLYTGLTAVGPTYFLPVLDALISAGVAGGLTREAAVAAAVATARGAAEMVRRRGEDPETLKLLTGLRPLNDAAVGQLVADAIRAAVERMDQVQRGFTTS